MVGDEALYGKDYVIEPKTEVPSVTANPAYTGSDAVEKMKRLLWLSLNHNL